MANLNATSGAIALCEELIGEEALAQVRAQSDADLEQIRKEVSAQLEAPPLHAPEMLPIQPEDDDPVQPFVDASDDGLELGASA